MLPNSHILLIDDAPHSSQDLSVILAFLGEEVILTTSANWQKAVEEYADSSATFKCVILGHCEHPNGVQGLLGQLDKWDENLPAILQDDEQASRWPEHLRQRLLAVLTPPLGYNQLIDALHRAQVYREVFDQRSRRQGSGRA